MIQTCLSKFVSSLKVLLMPKKLFAICCLISFCMLSSFIQKSKSSTFNSKDGIIFYKDSWASALQKAKAENKTIFLYIGASWCGPCKKLKAKTFTNAKVGAYFNANFICVSLDGEDGGDGTMLTEKYKLAYFPSLYFVDASSNVLKAGDGYYSWREILQFGKSVVK